MRPLYYPIFVSLADRTCLVVGGGNVAERKLKTLLAYGPKILIVAEKRSQWIESQCQKGVFHFLGPVYEEDFLSGVDLVFAVTNDSHLNIRIANDAHKRKLWCNMATDPTKGSFIVPSVLSRDPLTIAVSTAGTSPAFSAKIRQELETIFGPEWEVLLNFMGLLRENLQSKGLASTRNQAIFGAISDLPLPRWIRMGEKALIVNSICDITKPWLDSAEVEKMLDRVWSLSS